MARKNGNHYAGKHGQDMEIDPAVAETIKKKAIEGKLPCAVAFKISEETGVSPAEVGIALDLLEIKISKCQIGVFGYGREKNPVKPMADIPDSVKTAVHENLTDGNIACRDVWKVAEKLGIGRMDTASACDSLGIKISPCQLGAF
jgi:hypothetical protein